MTWMDSYARIHALTLSWVSCEDNLTDWVDEALWPLAAHADLDTMLWAMSAFVVITSRPPPAGVTPFTYRLACKIHNRGSNRDKAQSGRELSVKQLFGVTHGRPLFGGLPGG